MTTPDKQGLNMAEQLESACITAHLARQRTVTISVDAGSKWTKGFPSGVLLSVGTNGSKNYAVDPLKVLIWLRGRWSA